jgi:hypothetical protein
VKLPIILAGLALALIAYAFTNEGADPPSEQTPPPAATEATDPSVTDPEPVGDIGTALTVTCKNGVCVEKEWGEGLVRIDGEGVEAWRWRALKAERRVERLLAEKQRLLARVAAKLTPTAQEEYAVHLAAIAYGQSEGEMRRVADCESHFYAGAKNPNSTASGLFQFLTSTWASTPYGHLNIYEPVANALAAGWMWDVGRRGEWVC